MKPVEPYCPSCASRNITATSYQQYRKVQGKKRLVADAVCNSCGHSWWSVNKAVLRLAREADRARAS
jgi:hypothetical protein